MEFQYFQLWNIKPGIMICLSRWFEWDVNKNAEIHKLDLKSSDKVLTQLEDVEQQLALAFNNDGTILAVGGEV